MSGIRTNWTSPPPPSNFPNSIWRPVEGFFLIKINVAYKIYNVITTLSSKQKLSNCHPLGFKLQQQIYTAVIYILKADEILPSWHKHIYLNWDRKVQLWNGRQVRDHWSKNIYLNLESLYYLGMIWESWETSRIDTALLKITFKNICLWIKKYFDSDFEDLTVQMSVKATKLYNIQQLMERLPIYRTVDLYTWAFNRILHFELSMALKENFLLETNFSWTVRKRHMIICQLLHDILDIYTAILNRAYCVQYILYTYNIYSTVHKYRY